MCFVTDQEVRGASWVQPCRCRGSSRWVHSSCLLRWIDERQKGQLDSTVQCSQCQVMLIPCSEDLHSVHCIRNLTLILVSSTFEYRQKRSCSASRYRHLYFKQLALPQALHHLNPLYVLLHSLVNRDMTTTSLVMHAV